MKKTKNILTIYEYSKRCKISVTAVYGRIARGAIVPICIGKTMFINIDITPIFHANRGRKSANTILRENHSI